MRRGGILGGLGEGLGRGYGVSGMGVWWFLRAVGGSGMDGWIWDGEGGEDLV